MPKSTLYGDLSAGFHAPASGAKVTAIAHAVCQADDRGFRKSACGLKGRFIVDAYPWQETWQGTPEAARCPKCNDSVGGFLKALKG